MEVTELGKKSLKDGIKYQVKKVKQFVQADLILGKILTLDEAQSNRSLLHRTETRGNIYHLQPNDYIDLNILTDMLKNYDLYNYKRSKVIHQNAMSIDKVNHNEMLWMQGYVLSLENEEAIKFLISSRGKNGKYTLKEFKANSDFESDSIERVEKYKHMLKKVLKESYVDNSKNYMNNTFDFINDIKVKYSINVSKKNLVQSSSSLSYHMMLSTIDFENLNFNAIKILRKTNNVQKPMLDYSMKRGLLGQPVYLYSQDPLVTEVNKLMEELEKKEKVNFTRIAKSIDFTNLNLVSFKIKLENMLG